MCHSNIEVGGTVRTQQPYASATMSQMTQNDPLSENRRVGSSPQTLAGEVVADGSSVLDQRQWVTIDLIQLFSTTKFENRNSNFGFCSRPSRAVKTTCP